MPILFARIELRGDPPEVIYDMLHAHLKGKNWFQYLPGHQSIQMPHAMYQSNFTAEPDTAFIADKLKSGIEENVWTKALVLVIRESHWAQTAG